MPTIFERAAELVPDRSVIGLGSGRAALAFVKLLGQRIREGRLNVQGVPTSEGTAAVAREAGVPLTTLEQVNELAITVDGADEVAPNRDLIKGWGRALVRERIVAESSRKLVILVGEEKIVPKLGTRGKLPVEVVPFAVPLVERRLRLLGLEPVRDMRDGTPFLTDNGNHILDCRLAATDQPARLEADIRAIPGVVGTGFFLGLANLVLIGRGEAMELVNER